jgi:hypothetical protein
MAASASSRIKGDREEEIHRQEGQWSYCLPPSAMTYWLGQMFKLSLSDAEVGSPPAPITEASPYSSLYLSKWPSLTVPLLPQESWVFLILEAALLSRIGVNPRPDPAFGLHCGVGKHILRPIIAEGGVRFSNIAFFVLNCLSSKLWSESFSV